MRGLQQSGETCVLPSYLWTFSPPSLRGPARPVAEDVRHFVTLLCPYSIPSSSLPLFIISYPIPPSFSSLCLIQPSFLHSLLAPYLLFPPSFLHSQYLPQSFLLPLPIASFFHSLLQFTPSLTSSLLSTLSLPPPPPSFLA